MKFSKEERIQIGCKIYEKQLTVASASELYGVNFYTARAYLREYKAFLSAHSNN